MTIERREGAAHRVPPPDLSEGNMGVQIAHTIQLNQDAAKLIKTRAVLQAALERQLAGDAWPKQSLKILVIHISQWVPDVTGEDIVDACREVLRVNDLGQLAALVQDDMCSEFFNRSLSYCLREGQAHKKAKGFIDGSGIGYLKRYVADAKDVLEKVFDAKWHYKAPRPLAYMLERGTDLTAVANAINPGHHSYPQGHEGKALAALQTHRATFNLDTFCDRAILIAALAFGHGRDANLIHIPQDTGASGYCTDLKEWADEA